MKKVNFNFKRLRLPQVRYYRHWSNKKNEKIQKCRRYQKKTLVYRS